MKIEVEISASTIKEIKEIVNQLIAIEKEHNPYCTLNLKINVN